MKYSISLYKKLEFDAILTELVSLSEVSVPTEKVFVKIHFPFKKVSDEQRIIAGYASIVQVDKQNEIIPVAVLKEAWSRCGEKTRSHLMHTNIPVADIVNEFVEKDGRIHKTGVDDTGLYIVCQIWNHTKKANETWDLIQRGILKAFSIGGEALANSPVCYGDVCHNRIDKMDLHEVSIVDRPANPDSVFRILKRDGDIVDLPEVILIDKELLLKPIPKPRSGEEQDKYISRCVSALADADPEMENKQRVAICYNTWRESKKSDSTLLGDLLLYTNSDLYEKIQKGGSPIEELYDVFLVKRAGTRRGGKPRTDEERRERHPKDEDLPPRGTGLKKPKKEDEAKKNVKKMSENEIKSRISELIIERDEIFIPEQPKPEDTEKYRKAHMIDSEIRALEQALGQLYAMSSKEAKKSELSDGAIQSEDVIIASQQEVDSAVGPSDNAESKTKKISVKVKL